MAHLLGIDLGTTTTIVARVDEAGTPEIVRDWEGEAITPTALCFETATHVVVGREARAMAEDAEHAFLEFKRDMGTGVSHPVFGQRVTSLDLSALMLRRVRTHAEAAHGPVDLAVITIPANFTNAAREATLEAARRACPEAPFVHMSTNKVYGDRPNSIALQELETRWDYADPAYAHGIAEDFSIDQSKHSLFGASKVAADVMVQEYGRYFGMPTCALRGGCLTGPNHTGVELHGFLSYLVKCNLEGRRYTVFGYKGKQVRDNIHSHDLVGAFLHFFRKPRSGEVYNMGGGRHSNCSMLEAIDLCQEISGQKLTWSYEEENRIGDHIWWISDVRKFQQHYPSWKFRYGLRKILEEIYAAVRG